MITNNFFKTMVQDNFHNQNSNLDLPIIHKLIGGYKLWQEFLPNFPKTSRYSLGAKIDSLFIEMLELIFIACYTKRGQKLSHIENAIIKLDLLKFFLRISWEIKALDNKKYTVLSEQLDEIGRMIGGWAKQLREKFPPNV